NNASAVEVRANCIANIKARVITNLGSGASSQTVVWYGTGVLEADEIRNLADSSSAMDIQSSNFMVKGARIKSNVRGGVVAV
ncbi:hypothetical protein, partial [Listeria monocytogenes]|uniref:hypothetical protein n=1 Tax=Listeria monocytogenes TaxID=1639 RepID=UPI002FDC3C2E